MVARKPFHRPSFALSQLEALPHEDASLQEPAGSVSNAIQRKNTTADVDGDDEDSSYTHLFFEDPRNVSSVRIGRPCNQRLSPVRLISPTPPLAARLQREQSDAGWPKQSLTEDFRTEQPHRPRTFSRQCRHVMMEQNAVSSFDVISVYLACEFFQSCSLGFIRSLVLAGGPEAGQGVSVPPHADIFREGDAGSSLYVVVRGKAAVVDKSGGTTKEFGVSDHFGEFQALGVLPRRLETVRAMTYLQLLVVTQATMAQLLNAQSEEDLQTPAPSVVDATSQKRSKALCGSATMRRSECMYQEERRHFETEAVRLFKDISPDGGRARRNSRKAPALRQATKGELWVQLDQPAIGRQEADDVLEAASKPKLSTPVVQAQSRRKSIRLLRDQDEAPDIEDSPEANRARDHLYTSVKASLREDMRSGFKIPVDSIHSEKQKQNDLGKAKKAERQKTAELDLPTEEAASSGEDLEDDAAQAFINDVASPLDPYCLPPLASLSPMQKHGILRQLRHQQRAKAESIEKKTRSKSPCQSPRATVVRSTRATPRHSADSTHQSLQVAGGNSRSPRHTLAGSTPRSALSTPRGTVAAGTGQNQHRTLVDLVRHNLRFQSLVQSSQGGAQAPPLPASSRPSLCVPGLELRAL